MKVYYTYAYLKEDGTPYYIGKGKGKRLYYKYGKNCKPPKDRSRIIKLKQNLTEEEAFRHEIYMIAVFGKKCDGTGILMNIADGGNAPPVSYGDNHPTKRPEVKKKISAALKGRKGNKVSLETKQKISKTQKKRLKNNPRPIEFYTKNLIKMSERNRTDVEKNKKHSEFMKNQSYASKPIEYNNTIYPSLVSAMKETGLSRYYIFKTGGKFINNIK